MRMIPPMTPRMIASTFTGLVHPVANEHINVHPVADNTFMYTLYLTTHSCKQQQEKTNEDDTTDHSEDDCQHVHWLYTL